MKAPSSGTAEIESQNKDHESTCVQRELAANPKVSENQSSYPILGIEDVGAER